MQNAKFQKVTWKHILSFCLLPFAFCLVLTGCQTALEPTGLTVQVVQVTSGGGLEVADPGLPSEITERVRLEGIDVPEIAQQPWGRSAKERLVQLLNQHPVLLESDLEPRDASGQRLAYIWQDGQLLNETLVAEGYALVMPHPPNHRYDKRLAYAQDQARILGLGIWNPEKPMRQAPEEFRQQPQH